MTKVVYNACYGGFSLSEKAVRRYAEIKGLDLYPETGRFNLTTYWTVPPEERGAFLEGEAFRNATQEQRIASNALWREHTINPRDFDRADPALVRVVEEMGRAADGSCARLEIADLPAGTRYRITEYDGFEGIETSDEVDWSVA